MQHPVNTIPDVCFTSRPPPPPANDLPPPPPASQPSPYKLSPARGRSTTPTRPLPKLPTQGRLAKMRMLKTQAEQHLAKGNHAKAADLFNAALKLDPNKQPSKSKLSPIANASPAAKKNAALDALFNKFDLDRNGVLDHDEVAAMIELVQARGVDRRYVAQLMSDFARYDKDNSGTIDREEFEVLWEHLSQPAPKSPRRTKSSSQLRTQKRTSISRASAPRSSVRESGNVRSSSSSNSMSISTRVHSRQRTPPRRASVASSASSMAPSSAASSTASLRGRTPPRSVRSVKRESSQVNHPKWLTERPRTPARDHPESGKRPLR